VVSNLATVVSDLKMLASYLAVLVSLYGIAGHVGWRLVVSSFGGDGHLSGFLYLAHI